MSQGNQHLQQSGKWPDKRESGAEAAAVADIRQSTEGDERNIGRANDKVAPSSAAGLQHREELGDQAHQSLFQQLPKADSTVADEAKHPSVAGGSEAVILRSTRAGSAKVRGSESRDAQQQHPMRRIGIVPGESGDSGGTSDLLLRTRHFKKAKSAATFTLDGVSYTIGMGACFSFFLA